MSQSACFKAVWGVLVDKCPQPITFEDILAQTKYILGHVSPNTIATLKALAKARVVYEENNNSYSFNPQYLDCSVYGGIPHRMPGGNWGTQITLPKQSLGPKIGDLVFVTTKNGNLLGPKQIKTALPGRPYSGRVNWVCETTDRLVPPNGKNKEQRSKYTPPSTEPKTATGQPPDIDKLIKKAFGECIEDTRKALEADVNKAVRAMEGDVKRAVEEKAAELIRPLVIEVKQPDLPTVKIEGAHYLFPRLLKLISAGLNVFMWGPPGTGKTTAAMQVAEALSRKSEIDTLDPTTARSMVQGYMTPTGEHVHNVFTRCWEQGAIYIADEVDLAPGHVQTLFNSALANGWAPLAWGNVQRSSDFGFVATGNTAGRPNAAFPDRRPMSNAFADRLYFMHWPLDPNIECRAAGLTPPPIKQERHEECDPKQWVTFVRALRAWADSNAPTLSVTPRASLLGLQALALGESPEQVADALVFRGCDRDLRQKALRNIRW